MKPSKYYVFFTLILFLVLVFCGQEDIFYEEPNSLQADEFTFIPESPQANKNVSLVFFGCDYYVTNSIEIKSEEITIKKIFNSGMKRPCILKYDTISLGNLKAGDYEVLLKIIDINPVGTDSVFFAESKILKVR